MASDFLEEARQRVAAGQTKNNAIVSSGQSEPDFIVQARSRVATGQTSNQKPKAPTFSQSGVGYRPQTLMQKATGNIYDNPARKAAHQSEMTAGPTLPQKQSVGKTVFDVVDRGAGYFNQGVASTVDFAANLLPRAAGAIRGVDPEETFVGQVFKPVTDATGKFKDYVDNTVQAIDARIQNDTRDSKAAQVAANVGSGAVAALPNAALAFWSGGASAAGTLAPQATGAAATASAAAKKLVSNPMFKVSAAQTLGSSYDDAKNAGATDEQAIVAAVLSTAFNSAVEVGGGVETLPGALRGADLSSGKKALQWVSSMLDEGKEEVVQGVISGLTEKAVFDENRALYSATDENAVVNPGRMAKEFGMGAAVGGLLGGGQVLGDAVVNRGRPTPAQVDRAIQETFGQNKTVPTAKTETESTSVNTNPAQHTPQEQVVIEEYKNAVDEGLVQFAQGVENGSVAPKSRYQLKPISNRAANDILRITGVDTHGFSTVIEGRMIDHITKRHGESGTADHSMQDINDFGRIQYVIDNYDSASDAGTSRAYTTNKANGKPGNAKTVVFEKAVNGTYYVVEAVPDTKAKTTFVVSAYMSKNGHKKTGAEQLTDVSNDTPVFTPESGFAQTPNNSIPGSAENVNGTVGDMGAKTSDFKHEVKQSQTARNSIGQNESRWEVPEDQRVSGDYTAVTERESLNNARLRLEQDPVGEQDVLRRAAVWSNEEVDMGMLILSGLRLKAKESGDWSEYRDWAKVVKQHGVSSGQALQSWAKYTRRTGDGIMQTVSELLELPEVSQKTNKDEVLHTASVYADQFDDAVAARDVAGLVQLIQDTAIERKTKKRWGKKLGGEIDWALKRIAQKADAEVRAAINQEGTGELKNYEFLRNFAAAGIEDIAGDLAKPSVGEMATSLRRNAMLSKFATFMRNFVGNGVFDGADMLSRDISVPLDMLLSKFTGTRSVASDRGALSKEGRDGMADGLAMALLEVGLDVNAGGAESKYERSSNRTFKMSGNVISKALSAWEKYMGYALNVTDEAAKGSVEGRVQSGLDKLYEQGRIKDNTLRDGGAQEARYRTFQDGSVFSQVTTGVRNALNKAHVGKVGLGDVLIPFAQVPANLAGRAVDYSPVGLTKGALDLANVMIKAKKGTLTAAEQAKAVQEIVRGITGSTAIALFTALAAKGIIRVENPGGEDENKDKAAYEKMQGLTGTQFNLSAFVRLLRGESTDWQNGDELMSIAFLEPFNAHMTIGALLAEDMLAEGQLTPETVLKDSFTGTLAAISDMPLFSAFGDAYDAFQYSDKERLGERILDAGNTLLANEVSSIIPNSVKGIAQGLDPYQRDLYSKDGAWAQTADQFRAIFDRDSLPAKLDPYGRPMMNEGGIRNFLNTNILPGQLTTYKETDLDRAIQKTFEETGKAAIFPTRKAPDKITVDGETVELTPEQQRKYQEYYGQKELDTRAALFADDLYGNLDNANALKSQGFAEDYAKQTAKEGLLVGFEPEKWVRELAGKTPEEVADGIILKTFESMAENKKLYDNKYDGISGLLNDGTIDDKVALAIMSDSAVDGYMDYCKTAGVTVADYADVYAYMNKTDDKEKTLKYIEGLNMSKAKKVAIAQGIYGANPTFIPIDSDVPKNWLLEMGATDEIIDQFSDSQKELYNRHIRNTGVDMGDYLDIWAFKNSAKSDKDANGKTTYSAQNKTIDQIDRLDISNEDKRNLFLSLGYSEKNIPYWWK